MAVGDYYAGRPGCRRLRRVFLSLEARPQGPSPGRGIFPHLRISYQAIISCRVTKRHQTQILLASIKGIERMSIHRGTLRFWNEKGWGFITNDAGGSDFLHASALRQSGINQDTLQDGITRFSYDVEPGKGDKTQACNVELID
jgi:cold shock CspA family protein